jgi:hypothetical protein
MATDRAMLKEAIADAKAVKDTAIANAKAALEEAFTPQLKSMLSMKLQEMEDMDEMEDKNMYEMEDKESMEEGEDKDMMEVDLEELLAELNKEEGEMEEGLYEAEEGEEDEESEESEEGKEEGEPIELEDMTDEDLKDMIEDVIKDMIEAGELEAGHEEIENEEGAEDETEEMSDEEEVDLAELLKEIEEMEESGNELEEDMSFFLDSDGVASTAQAIGAMAAAAGGIGLGFLASWWKTKAAANKPVSKAEVAAAAKEAERREEAGGKTEMAEAYSTIETLKGELNEINLLNAKLLYTNKIFKAKNLNESQKVKVLSSFDKAKNVGEVKMVFETLNEGIKVAKNTIKENLGSASKSTGTPTVKKPIVESNDAFLRMQKLAGLI